MSIYQSDDWMFEEFKNIQRKLREKWIDSIEKSFGFFFLIKNFRKPSQVLPGFLGIYNLYICNNFKLRAVLLLPIKIESCMDEKIEE